jgi:hypothetical protein
MRILLAMRAVARAQELASALRSNGLECASIAVPETVLGNQLEVRGTGELRERLRRELDLAVAEFNPDLIHGEGLTFWGQLASETGVPYVATLVAADLEHAEGTRLRELAEQGAENARCVLVPAELTEANKPLLAGLENVTPAPWWPDALELLEAVYRAALNRPASGLA